MTPESRDVEWKRSWRDEHFEWICGFANAQGGVLEIGKDDGGEVVGVTGVLSLMEEIPNKVRLLLGIVVEVNLKSDDAGLEYIEIVVEPHTNPITYRGRVHYRSGSTKQVLEGAALTRFLLEKHGRSWDDVALPGVTWSPPNWASTTGGSAYSSLDRRSGRQFAQTERRTEQVHAPRPVPWSPAQPDQSQRAAF